MSLEGHTHRVLSLPSGPRIPFPCGNPAPAALRGRTQPRISVVFPVVSMVAGTGWCPCSEGDAPQMCFPWSEVAQNIPRKPQGLVGGAGRCLRSSQGVAQPLPHSPGAVPPPFPHGHGNDQQGYAGKNTGNKCPAEGTELGKTNRPEKPLGKAAP